MLKSAKSVRLWGRLAACGGLTIRLFLCIPAYSQTYKNPSAPTEQRIDDLVSRMTLEEKISQLMNDSPAIDHLGIPA